MQPERLEWLELSPPPAPAAKKIAKGGAAPCPHCGWPVAAKKKETCPHCGQSLQDKALPDLLAGLNLQLPPRLIELAPPPEQWFDGPGPDSPAFYDLRLQAERLQVVTGFDQLICLDDISVDHYQYQLEAALRALRDMRGQALLADEVGLGKTIEAGIIMKELIERGLANSILIIVPASLTWQWQEEMQTKFHEEFVVLEELDQLPPASAEPSRLPCRWLISLDRAKADRWAEQLLARDYDLLIVDEAHKLKNHRTEAYRFVNAIRKRYVLMLTATPVHNDLIELYNLVTILRPGHLGTRRAFRRDFVATVPNPASPRPLPSPPAESRPGLRTIYSDPVSVPVYLRKSHPVREKYRQRPANTRWIWQRCDSLADLHTLGPLGAQGDYALRQIEQLLAEGYEVVDFEAVEWARQSNGQRINFDTQQRQLTKEEVSRPGAGQQRFYWHIDFVCRLKLKPQPRRPRPSRPRVERRTTPHNPAALRGLLREIMIRNRRSSVGVRFPPRRAAVYYLNLTPPERALYDGVTAYIRDQLHLQPGHEGQAQVEAPPETRPKLAGPLRMALMTLQQALCSSPQAAAQTLASLSARQADPRLQEYLALARQIEAGRKVDAARIILEQHPGKFLIFTDYLATLNALYPALKEAGHETVVFHGGMSSYERVEAVRAFRQSARVMISTRSGGEGHNLQFCHHMINYDLPWNPMRIEQRIGRIHRLGQKQEVAIFNLSATQTIEAYILDLLAHKIHMFELVIGELDLILGQLDDERSFEQYIEDAWAGSRSEAELLQMIAELEALLGQAQTTYTDIRNTSDELSELLDE